MAEQENPQEEVVSTGKLSIKKLIILILAGVLLLAAGGAGTFFLLKSQMTAAPAADGATEAHDEEPEEEEHGHKKKKKKKKKEHTEMFYYDVAKPLIVDFRGGSSMNLVQIALTMVTGDQETVDVLKKNEPMIRNNLLLIISKHSPEQLNSIEGKEALRTEMAEEVAAILEKLEAHGEVEEVLFTSFIMQ